tara:strand:+ start:295 stop:495 length:201 start_codon:yes stop_codon:yes gene_type:complete
MYASSSAFALACTWAAGASVTVTLGQDLCGADVEEYAGALGVQKPHAEVLIAKWILMVRDLYDGVT